MNCVDCGKVISGGCRCMQCQAAYEQRTERVKKESAERERENARHGVWTPTYGGYGGNSGRSPSNSRQTSARTYRSGGGGFIKFIIIIIVIAGAFFGIRYWNYTSFEKSLDNQFTVDNKISDSSESFIGEIENRKENYPQQSLSITKIPDNYLSSIFNFISEKTVRMKYWEEDGVQSYYFCFYTGYDMGTGLEGKYYLTTVNGEKCLISEKEDTVYYEESSFYKEHYEKLMALTYDTVLQELTEKLHGGEYGTNERYNTTVLKTDTVAASVENDSDYTMIMDESGDERLSYVFTFSEKVYESVPDISGYKTVKE